MNPQQPDQNVDTTSLDLPPALQSLLNMGSIQAPAMPPSAGLSMTGGAPMPMPSYKKGGEVTLPKPTDLVDAYTGEAPTNTTVEYITRQEYARKLAQGVPLREMAAHERYLQANPAALRSVGEHVNHLTTGLSRSFGKPYGKTQGDFFGVWPNRAPPINTFGPAPVAPMQNYPLPSYADGGMIGPGGMPEPPAASGQPGLAPASSGLTPQQIQSEAQKFVQNNPRQVQEIQMALQQAMQSGDLTPQELNTLVQMATVALQNPEMYPQLRAMAIQEGLATPQDISPQFDPGILFTLVVVGQAMQQGGMQPQAQAQSPQPQTGQVMQPGGMPSMQKGGQLPTKSEPVPIMAHTGEYVIPHEVVKAKGTEFFDSLVAKYRGGNESA